MFNDKRGGKIALVAHCLLNQNAKVGGLARYPGIVPGIVDLLIKYDFGIIQIPCPEMMAAGIARWGQVKEQYMCYGFYKDFRQIAISLIDSISDYITHGYTIVLVGIDGSPSCGVHITESNSNWGGTMLSNDDCQVENIQAPGAFVELFQKEVSKRGMKPIPAIGLPMDLKDGKFDLSELEKFLASVTK
ncbi:MAG: CD3072 family TudS-related putative desulfidase [Bacillota bacterium]|jgi:predicted secreted protein